MDGSVLLILKGVFGIVVSASVMYGIWNYVDLKRGQRERAFQKQQNNDITVVRSRPRQKVAETIPYGLRLKSFNYDLTALRRRSWDTVEPIHPPEILTPLCEVDRQDLLWGRVFREPELGVRYDLRPVDGGPVAATVEWHQVNLTERAIAQVSDQLLTLYSKGGTIFAVDVNSGMTVATMNRLGRRVTIGNSRVYQWHQKPNAAFFSSTNGNSNRQVVKFDWSHRSALDDPSFLLRVHSDAPEDVVPTLTLMGLYQLAGKHA